MTIERVTPDWAGEPCIVAAPGPSLTADVVHKCRMTRMRDRWRVVAVQDAYRLMPWADALYGCDDRWWNHHQDCAGFRQEKWSTHGDGNDKLEIAAKYGVRLVAGAHGAGFSLDPGAINYGSNSGFQALNLAILKGCVRIVLVGFDMRNVKGQSHFFGDHPKGVKTGGGATYENYAPKFAAAAKLLPKHIRIVNATPDSALTCFPIQELNTALENDCLYRDRPKPDARTSSLCA